MTGTSNRRVSPPCCETASNHLPNGPHGYPDIPPHQPHGRERFRNSLHLQLGAAVRSSTARPTRRGGQSLRNRHPHVQRPPASLGRNDPGYGSLAPTCPLPPGGGWPSLARHLTWPRAKVRKPGSRPHNRRPGPPHRTRWNPADRVRRQIQARQIQMLPVAFLCLLHMLCLRTIPISLLFSRDFSRSNPRACSNIAEVAARLQHQVVFGKMGAWKVKKIRPGCGDFRSRCPRICWQGCRTWRGGSDSSSSR